MIFLLMSLLLLLFLGMPVAFALGLASIAFLFFLSDLPLIFAVTRMFAGIDSFSLLAIPLFVMTGNLMAAGGATKRILAFAKVLAGHRNGGLASVSIIGSVAFSGVNGSAVADASSLGPILIPMMKDEGYDAGYAVAINAVSSPMAIMKPPSISMILLATVTMASIRDMFYSIFIAGSMTWVGMLAVNWYISKKRGYPRSEKVNPRLIPRILFACLPALLMPVLVLGGIIYGVVTATEAALIAMLSAMFIGVFVYKELTLKKIYAVIVASGIQTAVVLFIIAVASILSGILSHQFLLQVFADWTIAHLNHPLLMLAFVSLISLMTGLFIDDSPALILLGALFYPIAQAAGIHVLHFSAVLVYALTMGLYTPPVGTTLLISSYIGKTSLSEGFKHCAPFLLMMLVVLACLIFFPVLSVGLPTLLFH